MQGVKRTFENALSASQEFSPLKKLCPLDCVVELAKKELKDEMAKLPEMEKRASALAKELELMQTHQSRTTLRKRACLSLDLQKLQDEIAILKSGAPEAELLQTLRPFIVSQKKLVEGRAADMLLKEKKGKRQDGDVGEESTCAEELAIAQELGSALKVNFPRMIVARHNVCGTCKNILFDSPHDSLNVCRICGRVESYLDTTQASMGYGDDIEITSFKYKRLTHFMDYLKRFQANESLVVPKEVLDRIVKRLAKQKVPAEDILKHNVVKKIMKSLNLSKYYNNVTQICYKLSGIPPPRMDPEQHERIILLFIAIQAPFDLVCPAERSNFLSSSFCLWQFCMLLGYHEFTKGIFLLKGHDNLKGQDAIFKQICEILNWKYVSAVEQR